MKTTLDVFLETFGCPLKPANDFAPLWGITAHEIARLCKSGRVPGARLEIVGGKATWMIPEGTQKPTPNASGPKPKSKQPSK